MIYRVEIRKDGSIASCDVVESVFTPPGGRVFYVDAHTKTDACQKAKNLFAKQYRNKHRQRLQAANLCLECSNPRAPGSKTRCNFHLKKNAEAALAAYRIKKLPEQERVAALAERQQAKEAAQTARRDKLRDNLAAVGLRGAAARRSKADADWDSNTGSAPPSAHSTLHQCLRAYERDPAGFRDWLLAKLGQKEATAAE